MADANLKRVAFVRHGETPLHVGANRFCGDLDPDLTSKGREQAAHARELLSHIMPEADAAWTSPRLRGSQKQLRSGRRTLQTITDQSFPMSARF
ncbi:MAG: histidine phosphatase family protein [Acidobacteria bacterium]|nr:histidine phosphatase family protein [Acidobacteriota bacterium]